MITKYIKQQLLSPQIMTGHPPALHTSCKRTHLTTIGFQNNIGNAVQYCIMSSTQVCLGPHEPVRGALWKAPV